MEYIVISAFEYLKAWTRGAVGSFGKFEYGSHAGERNEYGRPWSGVRVYDSPCVGTYRFYVRTLDMC